MRWWCCLCSVTILLLLLVIDVADSSLKEQAQGVLKKCRPSLQRTCPDPLYIKFHLYTRRNRAKSQLVDVTAERDNLAKTFFDPSHPNKVIIHGLHLHLYKSDLVSVKDAYLSREEANVWMVEWSKLAMCDMISLINTDHVADCVVQLITAINRHVPQPSIHVVADRAGARVAHTLAHAISPLTLTRITGLNPEGAVVPTENDDHRLRPWDADFVDTIHTSPFVLKSGMFGQVDFYVNPSRIHQPGCGKLETDKFVCDKRRAIQYFAESIITQVGFLAWECTSYTHFALGTCNPHSPPQTMGDLCSSEASGIYITYTAEESPYALGPWEENLYQEKGPKMRTDKISQYSTKMKKKLDLIDEKTPDFVKDLGIVDNLKSTLEDKTRDLQSAATKIGWNRIKALGTQFMKRKQHVDTVGANK